MNKIYFKFNIEAQSESHFQKRLINLNFKDLSGGSKFWNHIYRLYLIQNHIKLI